MIAIKKFLKTILPLIVASILVCSIFTISLIQTANASSKGFYGKDKGTWGTLQDGTIGAKADETYPYNLQSNNNATINRVGIDVQYGTSRTTLFQYYGEVPYYESRNKDGDYADEAYRNVHAEDGTSILDDVNPPTGSIKAEDYWGKQAIEKINTDGLVQEGNGGYNDKAISKADLETVNADNMKSVRLYAISHVGAAQNWTYVVPNWGAGIAAKVVGLVITMKNIDAKQIMDSLGLSELADAFTDNFIYNDKESILSPFTGFCIIMFIFAIAAYVIRYVTGKDKKESLLNMLLTVGLGALIIGACLSGRIETLGSSVADVSERLLYAVAGSLSSYKAFNTDIIDTDNENKVIRMQEMSIINKAYIDLQLCIQYNVDQITELDFDSFGDTDGKIAKKTLITTANSSSPTTGDVDLKENFDNNLGYYTWFANSSADHKEDLNKVATNSSSIACEQKMNSIVTYLQKVHNEHGKENKIANIVEAMSNPKGGEGMFKMYMLIVIFILLAIATFKYALNVVIGKLEMFLSLVGLTIAGPLLLTTKKKLVDTGKTILGMVVVSLIHITVYSIIFDVILYITAVLMQDTRLPSLCLTMAFLILMIIFNPRITQKLKQILDRAESKISPVFAQSKRATKNFLRQKASAGLQMLDNSQKVVGRDENGDPIYESRKGGIASKVAHMANNELFNEGASHQGIFKINSDLNKAKKEQHKRTDQTSLSSAKSKLNDTLSKVNTEASNISEDAKLDMKDFKDDIMQQDAETGEFKYNEDKLTENEKNKLKNKAQIEAQLDEEKNKKNNLLNNENYKRLCEQEKRMKELNAKNEAEGKEERFIMSEKNAAELKQYRSTLMKSNAKIKGLENQKDDITKEVNNSIDGRAKSFAYQENGLDENIEDIDEAAKIKAQQNHADEINKAADRVLETAKPLANNNKNDTGKITNQDKRKVNEEAVSDVALAQQTKAQLNNNVVVTNTLSEDTKKVVDKVVAANQSKAYKRDENVRKAGKSNKKETKETEESKSIYDQISHAMKTVDVTKKDKKKSSAESKNKVEQMRQEYAQELNPNEGIKINGEPYDGKS